MCNTASGHVLESLMSTDAAVRCRGQCTTGPSAQASHWRRPPTCTWAACTPCCPTCTTGHPSYAQLAPRLSSALFIIANHHQQHDCQKTTAHPAQTKILSQEGPLAPEISNTVTIIIIGTVCIITITITTTLSSSSSSSSLSSSLSLPASASALSLYQHLFSRIVV